MKTMIDDAIYTASPEIIYHRYNPLLGIVLTAGSIALLWANSNVAPFTENEILYQWNLLISSCILCTGLVMICYRLFGDSLAPIEKKSRERLYRTEFSFEKSDLPKVEAAVANGNFSLLQTLPHSYQPATQVICYRTDSGSLLAAQIVANRQPASEIRIFHDGEYDF